MEGRFMKASKKLIASALCVSMLASLGGCAMFDRDDEAVLAVADDYASAIVRCKARDIEALMVNGDDIKRDLETALSGYSMDSGDDYYDEVDAIADSLSYEIYEDTVESSKKNAEASVSVTYTLVDYDAIFLQVTEDGGNEDDFIAALKASDAPTQQISQTMDLVYENGEWLVEDKNGKNLFAIYAFYDEAMDFEFVMPLSTYVDEIEWYYSDDGVYVNYDEIELDIIPTNEGTQIPFEFTYEYYRDGELIYTSGVCTDQGYWIEAYYGPTYDPNCETLRSGCLVSGEYRCVIYDLAGNVLADSTCTVESEDIELSTDLIDYTEWYFSYNDVYTNEDTIELDIIPRSSAQNITWNFTYEYYRDGELIFTSDVCTDSGYWIEAYYGPNYDPAAELSADGDLVAGEYRCVIYDLDGNVLVDSTCTVEED
jgi:hypothetical protein